MPHDPRRSFPSLNRRAALTVAGAAAAALGLGQRHPVAAQESTPAAMANHPLVGTWAVATTGGVVPQTHGPDGSFISAFPPSYVDPALGLTFQGPGLGRWESTGARSGRFTFLQALSDAAGAYAGTFQLAADLEASEDGQTWAGTGGGAHIVVRDATYTVTLDQMFPIDPPVTATRMGATIESVVFPPARPAAATPEP